MVDGPERRCLPLDVEPISLHRERRPAPRRSRRSLRSRLGLRVRALLRIERPSDQ